MVHAIENSDEHLPKKVGEPFTVETATRMLPLISRIVADMEKLHQTGQRQRERLNVIDQLPDTIDQPDYQEELADIRERYGMNRPINDYLRVYMEALASVPSAGKVLELCRC